MKLSDSKHKLTCFVIMTLFPFYYYKNMLQFSGWSCSSKNGALLAKFHPGVLTPLNVLICECLLYSARSVSWPDISQSASLSDSKPECLYRQWCQLVLSVNNVRPNAHELGAGLSYNNNRENVCQKIRLTPLREVILGN